MKKSPNIEQLNHTQTKAFETPETISLRSAVQLSNIEPSSTKKRAQIKGPLIWFDTATLKTVSPTDAIFSRVINSLYSGAIVYIDTMTTLMPAIPDRMQVILKIKHLDDIKKLKESSFANQFLDKKLKNYIVSSSDTSLLLKLNHEGFTTCYESYVDDNTSLLNAIDEGLKFDYLWISFRDPTNIPLELVIASLQSTKTILMKEIKDANNVDDAIVSYGVMEYGAEGVIFSPNAHEVMSEFLERLAFKNHPNINLQVGTVTQSKPVGMGYRACIDTATLFAEDEGMLVGSTSQGGILCCPEVFFLPYMELRPFRINAGAVHSYVFNVNNRTDYMSELKAGNSVMVVNAKGQTRTVPVGRMKVEQRPLRLIEVLFAGGESVNILMQDDWHVRIFSDQAKPLNISELKEGDKVLGYITETGRHVGIKINENIIEN